MSAAERVQGYLDHHDEGHWLDEDLIAWTVDGTNAEHQLTVSDLREILAEIAKVRAS
jgi:hypothetical protein